MAGCAIRITATGFGWIGCCLFTISSLVLMVMVDDEHPRYGQACQDAAGHLHPQGGAWPEDPEIQATQDGTRREQMPPALPPDLLGERFCDEDEFFFGSHVQITVDGRLCFQRRCVQSQSSGYFRISRSNRRVCTSVISPSVVRVGSATSFFFQNNL